MAFFISFLILTSASGDTSEIHGLDALIERIGVENTPTGLGIEVAQIEAMSGDNYAPDVNNPVFVGKSFILHSGSSGASGHATAVGKRMYGTDANVGLAPNVDTIHLYNAEGWTQSQYLRFGSGSNPLSPPGNVELFNNSWIGSYGSATNDGQVLRRSDWSIDSHNVMMINGVANESAHSPLMSFGFNGISVGLANGNHLSGKVPPGYDQSGMQIPLIVADQNESSYATGVVSAVVALLGETRDTHPKISENFFANFSETMKSVLLTGARHESGWSNNPILSGVNRGRTNQPIDETFGVGTANIDRSHLVFTSGQHQSNTTTNGLVSALNAGWETSTLSSNQSKYIRFTTAATSEEVSIIVTWHQAVNSGFESYSLVDINIELMHYNGGKPTSLVGSSGLNAFISGNVVSESEIDTVEHLYIKGLAAGDYVLKVRRVDNASGARVFSAGWLFSAQDGIPGDLNGDGVVEVNDLLIIIAGWGVCSGDCPADLSGDGFVDISDILLLLSYWS